MEFNEAFVTAVKLIVKRTATPGNTVCKVIAVDKTKNICTCEETGTKKQIERVRLISVEDNPTSKVVIYPKIGSLVTIAYLFSNHENATVIKYGETESIELNGNQYGGLVKADVLKEEIDKLRDYASTLKTATRAIATALDALVSGTSIGFDGAMLGKTTGDFDSIKNENVKHG